MSSKIKRAPVAVPEAAEPVDHLADLRKWLAERNLRILPVAIGKVTGSPSNILDVLCDTHSPDWILIPGQTNDTNASSSG